MFNDVQILKLITQLGKQYLFSPVTINLVKLGNILDFVKSYIMIDQSQ